MTSINWNDTDDYQTQWAETKDPRVLAVITRDEDAEKPNEWCGCAPYVTLNDDYSYGKPGCGTKECSQCSTSLRAVRAYENALSHFKDSWNDISADPEEAAQRYMRVFHGADKFHAVTDSTDRSGTGVLVFTTQEWVDVCFEGGHEIPEGWVERVYEGAESSWTQYFEGDVWGIGHAVNPERTSHDEEVDFSQFEETYDCWGFYGEEYAKEEAPAGGYSELDLLVTVEQQMNVHPLLAFSLGRAKTVDEVKQIMTYSDLLKREDAEGITE